MAVSFISAPQWLNLRKKTLQPALRDQVHMWTVKTLPKSLFTIEMLSLAVNFNPLWHSSTPQFKLQQACCLHTFTHQGPLHQAEKHTQSSPSKLFSHFIEILHVLLLEHCHSWCPHWCFGLLDTRSWSCRSVSPGICFLLFPKKSNPAET